MTWLIAWLIYLSLEPHGPDAPKPNTGPFCPMSDHGSPEALLKLQMHPKIMLWISFGSKTKEPRYACLSEAKASSAENVGRGFSPWQTRYTLPFLFITNIVTKFNYITHLSLMCRRPLIAKFHSYSFACTVRYYNESTEIVHVNA